MHSLIDAAFGRTRTVALAFLFILVFGTVSYMTIPKESSPDIPIPMVYVFVTLDGIAPEDAERLLVRPLETELQSVEGIKEMNATASEGHASVMLEFAAGFDADAALDDVREAVDRAKVELPQEAEEPVVQEVNTALFPILTAVLSGPVPERTLVSLGDTLQDRLEAIPGVLEVDIGGEREALLEVLVNPTMLETYGISFETLLSQVGRNNRLVAAGAIDTGAGRLVLKVPGTIEDVNDVLELPIKVDGSTVVTFKDVASVRRTFRDPQGFARINGQPSIALEIKKRSGANIIDTVAAVRAVIDSSREDWPESVTVNYLQDSSEQVRDMLGDLENNVLTAVLLVMIVIVGALGVRTSLLVGLAIPGSFLAGIAVISFLGLTLNIVVLFSLILVVGMLVDGAIVTTELADRRLADGASPKAAYAEAAKRMAWPIITSTATTLCVFLPLLFWSGVVGEFMKFLPITVLITLTASLFMALVFIPVLGGMIGKRRAGMEKQDSAVTIAESGDLSQLPGLTGAYVRVLRPLARRPGLTLFAALAMLMGAYGAYGAFGRGVEFFPSIEPEFLQIQVKSRDNLSIWEKDALVAAVEQRVLDMDELESVYARTLGEQRRQNTAEDVIGIIQLELIDWEIRRPASEIIQDLRARTANIAGVLIQVREQEQGPTSGKPIQLHVSSKKTALLEDAVGQVRSIMADLGGFADVEDSRPLPGVEWQLAVDRSEAARYGADVTLLGQAVQLLTVGVPVAEYRPDDTDEEVDIRIRFPRDGRTLEQLTQLRIPTEKGMVPIQNFVTFQPVPKTGTIERIDARRVMTVEADVAEGEQVAAQVSRLSEALAAADLPEEISFDFAGESEDQQESMIFLATAFVASIFLMLAVLVTQFNSFYQAILVLSAIVFSTAGVFLGLLVTGRPFGIVMGGIGVIALAGIVVNNNIVLIDTYNDLRRRGEEPLEAVLRTGAQRLRPVFLTSITTVLGLMPMVVGVNIDLLGRDMAFGAPSTQWWTELSSAIAGGLTVATVLTLILTPSLLILGERLAARMGRHRPTAGAGQPAQSNREEGFAHV